MFVTTHYITKALDRQNQWDIRQGCCKVARAMAAARIDMALSRSCNSPGTTGNIFQGALDIVNNAGLAGRSWGCPAGPA